MLEDIAELGKNGRGTGNQVERSAANTTTKTTIQIDLFITIEQLYHRLQKLGVRVHSAYDAPGNRIGWLPIYINASNMKERSASGRWCKVHVGHEVAAGGFRISLMDPI